MVLKEECVLIGDRYYLKSDVYLVLEARIDAVVPEDV
jgi:hypothetical protein